VESFDNNNIQNSFAEEAFDDKLKINQKLLE
jgi:hypothetical protein